jgi:nucleoside-diphosphate-sugar epimerase
MKRALIIGGSYFVGRVFVEELLKTGEYEVHVLNRGRIPIRKEGVHEHKSDRHDPARLREVLPRATWDAVVDFCAYKPEDVEIMLAALQENAAAGGTGEGSSARDAGTGGAPFQVPAPKIPPVGQYIYISTASVYGRTDDLPVREDAPKLDGPQPELGPFADYAFDKWRTEAALERLCSAGGVPFTILRPAFIYGKYNYAPRESYFFDLVLKDETVVVPEERLALFSFVSVWDAARIAILCMGNEKTHGRAFNLASDDLVSYPRLVEVLEIVTGKTVRTRAMRAAEIVDRNVPLPFPLDEHLLYSGALAAETLGFRYTPFLEGMRETYTFYLMGRKEK